MRRLLLRIHVWLGWIVGVPLLFWTASGLFMVSQPIETVRGAHLKRPTAPLVLNAPVIAPATGPRPVKSMALETRPDGPKWVISYAGGGARLADPATGKLLPAISVTEAGRIARAAFAGNAVLQGVTRTAAEAPPLDLRKSRPAWRASFADGTNVYIDADTGAVLATRTRFWRAYDFMWGLHIMDLQTREDTSHPVLIGFAVLALVSIMIGVILLPMRRRRIDR
jgi:PepSY-associated TM region/Peptidase propeptide and YPEB domain